MIKSLLGILEPIPAGSAGFPAIIAIVTPSPFVPATIGIPSLLPSVAVGPSLVSAIVLRLRRSLLLHLPRVLLVLHVSVIPVRRRVVAVVQLRDDVEVAGGEPVAVVPAAILRVPRREVVPVEGIVLFVVDGGPDSALRLAAVDPILLGLIVRDDRERRRGLLRAGEDGVWGPVSGLLAVARRGDDALDVLDRPEDLQGFAVPVVAFVEASRGQDPGVPLPVPLQRPAIGAAAEELVDANLVGEHVPKVVHQEGDVHHLDEVGALLLRRRLARELVQDDGHEQVGEHGVGHEEIGKEVKRSRVPVTALPAPVPFVALAVPVRRPEDALPVPREHHEEQQHGVGPVAKVGVLVQAVGEPVRRVDVAVEGNPQARVHEHQQEEQ